MPYVRHLSLTDLRNYASLDIAFEPGTTALVGANGQGKTNIVEAIVYLSTLSSHRVATDAPLIRHGSDRAVIQAEVIRDDRSAILEVEVTAGRANKARVNRSPLARTRDILGILRTVIFSPEDLTLVKGDPSDRRAFLDDLLVQRQPRLSGVRSDYDRVLRQRNALLKTAGGARRGNLADVVHTLEVWDEQIATIGADLMVARADLVESLRPRSREAYAGLVPGGATIDMTYQPGIRSGLMDQELTDASTVRAAILTALADRRHDELDRGITLVGPHRDEVLLTLGEAPVKGYASHGESWSAALALRLASYDLLTQDRGEPVLILDDVFAELDTSRREHLAARVAGALQVFITAAVPADVPPELRGNWFDVSGGQVMRRDAPP